MHKQAPAGRHQIFYLHTNEKTKSSCAIRSASSSRRWSTAETHSDGEGVVLNNTSFFVVCFFQSDSLRGSGASLRRT